MNDARLTINQLVNATNGSAVSNVVQQVFVGEYERLRDAYIHPWPIFERVDVDHFVGREWLLAEVDDFLDSHDRGYFILEAEAGLGKTAFLAWLVKKRGYIHHFAELAPGLQGIGQGLKSVAAQLVVAHELEAYQAEGVLPGAAARPDFLLSLLKQSAAQQQKGEKIVLVIDALDEAGVPYNQNVLGLPSVLPKGVYFIVSQRPVALTLQIETPHTARRLLRLTSNSNENLCDMRQFLKYTATWHSVAQAIQSSNLNTSQFVTTLLDKCQGVWIYLHYIVREIERGHYSPLDLNALPDGMTQYYSRYWQNWRNQDEDQWYTVYLPLLATLAAAQEAITADRLTEWASIEIPARKLRRLLKERWRPFLSILERNGQTHFRFYHVSLRDFFEGQAESDSLVEQEKSFVFELGEATQEAHHRLAERYLKEWGGLEKRLPGLQDPKKQEADGRYGLRNLTVHLERANRIDDLHQLLQVEWVKTEEDYSIQCLYRFLGRLRGKKYLKHSYHNIWYTIKDTASETDSYLGDIERAWQLARKQTELRTSPYSLRLQYRYALIVSSINTLAQNMPPNLIKMLVKNGVWPPEKAVVYSQQVHQLAKRMKLWLAIADYLPEQVRVETLSEVFAVIRNSKLGLEALNVLPQLASKTPESLIIDLWQIIKVIEDEDLRIVATIKIASYLPQNEKSRIATEAYTLLIRSYQENPVTDPEGSNSLSPDFFSEFFKPVLEITKVDVKRLHLLIKLIHYLPPKSSSHALRILQDIIFSRNKGSTHYAGSTLAQGVHNQGFTTYMLVDLAVVLDDAGERERVLELAHQLAGFDSDWADAYAYVIAHLSIEQQKQILQQVLEGIRTRGGSVNDKVKAYAKLSNFWPSELMSEVIDAVMKATDPQVQMEAIIKITPFLSEPLIRRVLSIADALPNKWKQETLRAEALAVCVPHLPGNKQIDTLNKALSASRVIQDDNQQVEVLISLASYLSDANKNQILAKARCLKDNVQRTKNLLNLVPHTFEEQEEILKDALSTIKLVEVQEELPDLLKDIPRLPLAYQNSVLEFVRTISDKKVRARALVTLAPKLSESLLPQVIIVAEQLSTIETRQMDLNARAMAELLPYLPDIEQQHLFQELITMLVSIPDEKLRAKIVEEIVTIVPDSKREQLVTLIMESISDERLKSVVFLKLIPFMSEIQQTQMMSNIWTCVDENTRLTMSAILLTSPISKIKYEVFTEMLQHLGEDQLAKWMCELTPYLPAKLKTKVLITARQIQDSSLQAKVLSQLVSYPPDSLTIELLTNIQSIPNHEGHAFLLAALIVHVATPLLQETLSIVQEIEDPKERTRILVRFIPYLSSLDKQALLQMIQQVNDEKFQAEALLAIARYLPEEGLSIALKIAQNITIDNLRAELLVGLVPYLPKPLYEKLVTHVHRVETSTNAEQISNNNVLDNINSIQDEAERVQAIIKIAPRLPAHDSRALIIAEQISNEDHRVEALAALVPFLNDSLKQEVSEQLKNVGGKDAQAKGLVRIIPFLPTHPVQPVRYFETSFNSKYSRDEALISLWELGCINIQEEVLAGYLAHFLEQIKRAARVLQRFDSDKRTTEQHITEIFKAILDEFFGMIDGIVDEGKKLTAILYLIPHFTNEQRHQALRKALLLIQKLECKQEQIVALMKLAPYLTNSLFGEAQVILRRIDSNTGELKTGILALEDKLEKGQIAEKQAGCESSHIITELPRLSLQDIGSNLVAAIEASRNPAHVETLLMLTLQILESSSIQILEILRIIKDEDKKANIIKQIAPYFPENLQDQVLALACTINEEAVWAEVLSHLRHRIPKAGLWEAFLWEKLAHEHELKTRMSRLDESLTSSLLKDVEDIRLDAKMKLRRYAHSAKNQVVEESWIKTEALLALFPSLPNKIFWTVLKDVWTLAYQSCSMRPEILARLVPELARRGFIDNAFLVVQDIDVPHLQAEAIKLMGPYLKNANEIEKATSLAATIQVIHWQSMAFMNLAFSAANSGYPKLALTITDKIHTKYPSFKAQTLVKLLSCLTDDEYRKSVLNMCHGLVPTIKGDSNRAQILGGLARHLEGLEQKSALIEAINAASAIEEPDVRAKALESLAQILIQIQPQYLHALWSDLLWRLAERTRQDLLSDIKALRSVIVFVGGAKAVETMFDEIEKASRWWP